MSNFGVGHLEKLMTTAKVTPAVNQIELSPYLQRHRLVAYCKSKGIVLEVDLHSVHCMRGFCKLEFFPFP